MSDIRLQEIVTRAVVGRGDHRVVWSHATPAGGADSVLGVHVSNASVSVEDGDGEGGATLQLRATCDLWCACGDETRVERLVCTHTEDARVELTARVVGQTETKASLIRGIRCLEAEVRDGQLNVKLETSVAMEITGLARLWIKTYDLADGAGDADESDVSFDGSSTGSSGGDYSSPYSGEEEEADELDGIASLAARPEPLEEAQAPLPPTWRPAREPQPVSRASVISHFQQSSGSGRVSILQGH